jgi:hypothetical protein
MLLLMLRKHITWLRTKRVAVRLLPLDHHIDIHKTIGITIMIETILHVVAHLAYLGTFDVIGERVMFVSRSILFKSMFFMFVHCHMTTVCHVNTINNRIDIHLKINHSNDWLSLLNGTDSIRRVIVVSRSSISDVTETRIISLRKNSAIIVAVS